jgi:DNA-binding MarR family transcriptional regulator
MINTNLLKGLRVLGLTNKEAEALVAVVARGSATAGEISGEIGVHYPVVYRLLSSLERKGWVEASQDRPKYYRPRRISAAVEEASQGVVSTVLREAQIVKRGLMAVKDTRRGNESRGTWIIRGWDATLKKAGDLARKAKKSVFIVGKDPLGEEDVEDILKSLSSTAGYINLYLVAEEEYTRLRRQYPGVNYQITLRNSKADPTRFLTLFIIFDEREALFVNACYRKGKLEKEKVYATWEKNPEVINILMIGNNLKFKAWSPG